MSASDRREPNSRRPEQKRSQASHRASSRRQESRHDVVGERPLLPLLLELPTAGARQPVEPGAAVVVRDAPRGCDVALLLELEQGGIERARVQRQPIAARLLDPPRDAVAVQLAERLERRQHHQRERALPDFGLCFSHWVTQRNRATTPLGKQLESRVSWEH